MHAYVQVVAQHVVHPERLLVRCSEGSYALWFGDDHRAEMVDVEPRLADYLETARVVRRLPVPHLWFHLDDLPLAPASSTRGLSGR